MSRRILSEEDLKVLENLFTYHPPTTDDGESYNAINAAAFNLARTIAEHCPQSADRTDAIRKVREARMVANASIACHGASFR